MSGLSTTLFFKKEFNEQKLFELLNSIGKCEAISENEYELTIIDRLKDQIGEYDLRTEVYVMYSVNKHENYGYNEGDWIRIVEKLDNFYFSIDITFMTNDDITNRYLLSIFSLIKTHSDFYFVNQKFNLELLGGNSVEIVNEDIYLISSDLLEYMEVNNLSMHIGYN